MKIRTTFVAVCSLLAGGLSAKGTPPISVANRPVLWYVRFDAERLRSGIGKELFASLDPVLASLSAQDSPVGGKLESLAIYGFQPQKEGSERFPLLADLRFSSEGGGISARFEAISKKRGVPIESLVGHPALHFQHQGREVWIAKFSDSRVLLSTSAAILEPALKADADGLVAALPPSPGEILGGNVEIGPLLANNAALRDSELLKLLPHLDFHVLSVGEQLELDASADLDSERSASRAAKIIDGMVAAISISNPNGIPWDERLLFKQDGSRLSVRLNLEQQEAKKLFEDITEGIEARINAERDDE